MNPQTDEFNQKLINLPKLHQIINYFPLTISPNSYVTDAINLMNQQLNHPVAVNNLIRQANDYILVVEGKQLQGIFTIPDVLRVIALNTNLSGLKMAEVMNQPLITLKQSDSAHILTVLALFQQHCIQHLPIVDDQDNLIGIVNKTNLLQSLNIEKMVGVVEALQENLEDLHTEHIPINQQLEVTRWQTHNYLQLWAKKQKQVADSMEREFLQKSLQESETRLTLALKAGKVGIWDWHIQTNQTFWSSTMGLMYGLPLNTLCPDIEDLLNLIYPEDRQYYQNCLIQSLEERINFICEYRIVGHDNSLHWLSSRGEVYCNENGQPIRLIGTTRDISERKQTEQQISEQAALLEIATDGIFVRNFQAQILFWNQGAEKIYGWQRQEVAGKNPKDIFYDSTSHEQEIIPLRTVVKSGSWQGELHKRTQSNQLIIVQSRWTLMLDDDGQPKSILTVDTDITAKKQLEKQFFRAQKMETIGTLAGGIAHNINNNLTPILGYAQLLKSKSQLDKNNCLEMLTIIEDNAKKGASLVKQLLSFANKGVEIKYTILVAQLLNVVKVNILP
ncbi:PAS domain-containing protein, partial [Dolichospermum sp. ST_con]|nr:PAS domain-containing protein [Dolichospermum sp. ST_con]